VEESVAQMQQGLAAFRAMGAELIRTALLHLLATTYANVGQREEGLRVVAEALTVVDKTGERFSEAELYRLKGELLLTQEIKSQKSENSNPQSAFPNPQSDAEACFLKAIDVARQQQATSLELRATMSLARLWQRQGKQPQAHKVLAEVYHWFTEGFATKDL
jgi:predicted ATPase